MEIEASAISGNIVITCTATAVVTGYNLTWYSPFGGYYYTLIANGQTYNPYSGDSWINLSGITGEVTVGISTDSIDGSISFNGATVAGGNPATYTFTITGNVSISCSTSVPDVDISMQ